MGDKSSIEWCDSTWNPLAAFDRETEKRGWFCTKVSPGCTNCYAEVLNKRLGTGHLYRFTELDKIEFRLVNVDQPMRWRRPRRIFVNSMTDLFHEAVPDAMVDQVFAAMALAPQHVFQILTKRPERMQKYCSDESQARRDARGTAALELGGITDGLRWPLPNVWLGTSVEDQVRADERIPHLLRTPAAVRFLSCEPLLGPIDIDRHLVLHEYRLDQGRVRGTTNRIKWVIIGGESGTHARPFGLTWARSLIQQCRLHGTAPFLKQLGSRPSSLILLDKKGGWMDEWPEDLRVRDFPDLAGDLRMDPEVANA